MSGRSPRPRLAPLAVTALLLACAGPSLVEAVATDQNRTLEQQGSPFRYQTRDVGGGVIVSSRTLLGTPTQTAANDALQADVRALIGRAEAVKGRSAEVRIRETRAWPREGAGVREIWVLDGPPHKTVAYVILLPSPPGGTEIALSGPFE